MDLSWISLENPVALWWIFLCSATVVNVVAWFWTRSFLNLKTPFKNVLTVNLKPENMVWYSAAYVFGCGYRSIFPKADVQRIALFDSWLSSVFLGRTVATIAELAFVIQWAIVIRFLSSETKSSMAYQISKVIVPIIIVAECFSWFAVITTNYLGNSIEESLWAVSYSLIFMALFDLRKKFIGAFKTAITLSLVGCILYVGFMVIVDVPMYIDRLIQDTKEMKVYFGLWEGLVDLNTRWIVTYDINHWRTEIPWMTLYFSFAVLISIALCYVPITKQKLQRHLK